MSITRKRREAGQTVLLVVLSLSIFLMAALGLAIDGSHLYVQRQLAQSAADAAAQAGMMSVFGGTYLSGTHQFSIGSGGAAYSYTCAASDAATPCYYAQTLNGFNTTSDTVTYTANPSGLSIPGLSPTFSTTANLLQVTVQRNVPATLMGLLGWTTIPVTATGVAAIVAVDSPVPIIVTHPTLASSFTMGGSGSTAKITVCGGPIESIQVNSTSATSMSWTGNPLVDLSHAGPLDPGDCSTGTGADLGNTGGPSSIGSIVSFGSTGAYLNPFPPISDPLAGVSAPPDPTIVNSVDVNPPTASIAPGTYGCPASATSNCTLFFPGKYTSGIDVKNMTAVFAPGIYYMYGTGSNFTLDSNGDPFMAIGLTDTSTTGVPTASNCCGTGTNWTENMLIYMTGPASSGQDAIGTFTVNANAGKQYTNCFMIGAPDSSSYKGIFLFADRSAQATTHSIDGGAQLLITGTLYTTSTLMFSNPAVYQTLNLQGSGGGTTKLTGEIITSVLSLQGTPGIVMNLNSTVSYKLDKVALVQ